MYICVFICKYLIVIVLSLAYETLSNPSSKLIYDLSSKQKSATSHTNSTFVNNVDNPDGTFHRVLHQVSHFLLSLLLILLLLLFVTVFF